MTDRIEIVTDYSILIFHPGPLDEKLCKVLLEDFQLRTEQGLDPLIHDLLGAVDADDPTKIVVGDGKNRGSMLIKLGLPVRIKVRQTPYEKGEVVKLRATTLTKRKNATAKELADIATAAKKEMGFKNWAETAKFLDWSTPRMSAVLGYKGYPEWLLPQTEGLGAVVVQMIGKVRPVEHMEQALRFAHGDGKPATKDQVILYLKKLKGEKRGRKPQTLTLKIDGRTVTIELKPGDKGEHISTLFESGTKRVAKYKDAPAHTLGFLSA